MTLTFKRLFSHGQLALNDKLKLVLFEKLGGILVPKTKLGVDLLLVHEGLRNAERFKTMFKTCDRI